MEARTKSADEKFCHECGELIRSKAEICPRCGVRQTYMAAGDRDLTVIGQGQPRSKNTAVVLALLLGGLGIHKFYLGKPIVGIVYIVFIWTFIPSILGLIEGLYFLVMSHQTFNERYGGPAWAVSSGPTPDTHVKCPDCKELILKQAHVCKHCGCKLIPQV